MENIALIWLIAIMILPIGFVIDTATTQITPHSVTYHIAYKNQRDIR